MYGRERLILADLFERLRDWLEAHASWKSICVVVLAVAVCAFFGGTLYQGWQKEDPGLTLVDEAPSANDETAATDAHADNGKEVVVHVVGEVTAAGVYTLPAGARIDDAVRAAGATATADLSQLNLAQKLTDGQKITVPSVNNQASAPAPAASEATETTANGPASPVNINTATAEQLQELPNIGEVRAKAIIAYREANGGFQAVEDLKKVNGIGEKTFADMAPFVTV